MKRIGLLIVGIMIFITGCDKGRYVDIPKGYVKSEEYFDKEGIQDFSDYAKYIYNDEIFEDFSNNINNFSIFASSLPR